MHIAYLFHFTARTYIRSYLIVLMDHKHLITFMEEYIILPNALHITVWNERFFLILLFFTMNLDFVTLPNRSNNNNNNKNQ